MYYFLFIVYVVLATLFALALFIWALKNRQFEDQQRARFLPLVQHQSQPAAERPEASRFQQLLFGLPGLLAALLLAGGIVLAYTLLLNP